LLFLMFVVRYEIDEHLKFGQQLPTLPCTMNFPTRP
jgi:hypothetical protein